MTMTTSNLKKQANLLRSLHIKGNPLILLNIWDAGSAQIVEENGAKVIGTESYSATAAQGFLRQKKIPFNWLLFFFKKIIDNIDSPLTVDLGDNFDDDLAQIQQMTAKIIETGVVGITFEDQIKNPSPKQELLYSIDDQCKRIKAIRDAANKIDFPLFINARTNLFLQSISSFQEDRYFKEAVQRSIAYAEAGADGFFVPGLTNPKQIERLCELVPLPLNIKTPLNINSTKQLAQLAQLGVARISYESIPYYQTMNFLKHFTCKVFG